MLAFDPSWFARDKMFAFPLTAFTMARDKDDLRLDVDRNTGQAMKNIDAVHWGSLSDLDFDFDFDIDIDIDFDFDFDFDRDCDRNEFIYRPVSKR